MYALIVLSLVGLLWASEMSDVNDEWGHEQRYYTNSVGYTVFIPTPIRPNSTPAQPPAPRTVPVVVLALPPRAESAAPKPKESLISTATKTAPEPLVPNAKNNDSQAVLRSIVKTHNEFVNNSHLSSALLLTNPKVEVLMRTIFKVVEEILKVPDYKLVKSSIITEDYLTALRARLTAPKHWVTSLMAPMLSGELCPAKIFGQYMVIQKFYLALQNAAKDEFQRLKVEPFFANRTLLTVQSGRITKKSTLKKQ